MLLLVIWISQTVLVAQSENDKEESVLVDESSANYLSRWGMQFIQIQNQVAGLIGFSSGVEYGNSIYIGISGYANLTHEKVNTGLFGIEFEQKFNSEMPVQFGYNLFGGIGIAKDYQKKNNLLDNFLNIFGTNYYFFQPSLLMEINFTKSICIDLNFGYRIVAGLNETSKEIALTKLRNHDLNNFSFSITFKIPSL
jgi:hypothetical protein